MNEGGKVPGQKRGSERKEKKDAIPKAEHCIPKKTSNEKWIKDIQHFSSQATSAGPCNT